MVGVAVHVCAAKDEMGDPLPPEMVTCGICRRSWCERCDPAPSALCVWCHGRGYSTAPIPPRQRRKLDDATVTARTRR